MPTWIRIIHGIVITVCVKVKSICGFWIKISCIIGGDESSPLGAIVSRVQEIPTCFGVEVIASVSDGVIVREV